MQRYPREWNVAKASRWPTSPTEMSISLLHKIEDCPHKWALEHADYPDVWDRHGYPNRAHLPSMTGTIIHSSVEKIMSELAKAGCISMSDERAVSVMRSLGGYTAIIQSSIEKEVATYRGNPRTAFKLDFIRSTLLTSISEIRSKVQLMLGRMSSDGMGVAMFKRTSLNSMKQRGPLPHGIHPEVDMHAPRLHWLGRADLVILSDSLCQLVDFKTGEHSDWHELQMRVYAILWYNDSILNPNSRPVNKLTLSYLQGNIDVTVPTGHLLDKLKSEIVERWNRCLGALSVSPPSPRPHIDKCPFCDVRHLCAKYWSVSHKYVLPTSEPIFGDLEITICQPISQMSWRVNIDGGSCLEPGLNAVLRLPPSHYLIECARPLDRLRILNAGVFSDTTQDQSVRVLSLNSMSEVYLVEENI